MTLVSRGIRFRPSAVASSRTLFRTAWELPQRTLIDIAVARAPFIDQSQSLNLFLAAPSIGKLSSMYLHAWKSGLKTTYYLRSRPATRIQQVTHHQDGSGEGCTAGSVSGTSWHGIFENDAFRRAFLGHVADQAGHRWVPAEVCFAQVRDEWLDALGDLGAEGLDTALVQQLISGGPPAGLPGLSLSGPASSTPGERAVHAAVRVQEGGDCCTI